MDHPSKRLVTCGICKAKMRRDDLKTAHFPKYHPGLLYKEKGEQSIKSMFGKSMSSLTNSFKKSNNSVSTIDLSCESMEAEIVTSNIIECPDVTLASDDGNYNKAHNKLNKVF